MTTGCLVQSKRGFGAFPSNLGVSTAAYAVERLARELQDIINQSITVGKHYRETVNSLGKAINEYSVDNWDGYGAKAVDKVSCKKAISFSQLLPMNVPVPEVYIDPDGEVTFEWYAGPRRVFSVTVRRNNELVYAGLFGANKAHGVEHLDDELPETILDNVSRVYAQ